MLALQLVLVAGLLEISQSCSSRLWLRNGEPKQLGIPSLRHVTRSALKRRDLDFQARSLKRQAVIPDTTPFPCILTDGRSKVRPSSVHRLRPGDIDVVGAIGDSLTAGFGAVALDIPSVILGNRGLAFSIGGEKTWRTVFTLPNVLKLYNPKLVGYSLGDGFVTHQNSQFNVAEGFAASTDLLFQAKLLVQRMRSDPRVNFKEHWKMVTISMGANDFCQWICYVDPKRFTANHRRELITALNYLRDSMPRLFINFVPPPHIYNTLLRVAPTESCHFINNVECSCVFNRQYKSKQSQYDSLMKAWQEIDLEITSHPEYQNKEDFAIVLQPFTLDLLVPQINRTSPISGKPYQDPTFLAPDCFHFSQKMHSIAANALWNNLLQPVGSKSRTLNQRLLEEFVCPNKTHPYLFTQRNSDPELR